VALMVVGAVLIAGCGGGGEETAEATPTPTKAEFIRKADSLCKEAREKIVNRTLPQLAKLDNEPKAAEELESRLVPSLLVPTLEDEAAALQALGAPAGDEAKIEKILELFEGAIEEARTEPETYIQGDSYKEGTEHYGKAYELALEYGMKECPMR
jgi:hypothetical protein